MNILVVLAHPDPGSFSHALARAAADQLRGMGHDVTLRDLYAEGFEAILPGPEIPFGAELPPVIREHCDLLATAEGIVIVHPNWWGMPPAILKGWVDRVVRPGVAYEFLEGDGGEGVPNGLLRAKAAVVFNTGNTPLHRELEAFGDPLERLWRDCIFDLCGVREFHRRLFTVIVTSDEAQRKAWLAEARQMVEGVFT